MSAFEPPPYPPSGWYQDPEHPRRQRWWDGRAWAPSVPAPPADRLPEVGETIGDGTRRVRSRWRALGTVALLTAVPSAVVRAVGLHLAFDGVEIVDGELVGWSGDRIVPLLVVAVVVVVSGLVSTVAIPLLMLEDHDTVEDAGWSDPMARTAASELRSGAGSIGRAFKVLPRFVGWSLLLGVGALLGIAMVALVGVAIGPAVLLVVLPLVPLVFWLGCKLAFLTVAIIDRPGTPFRRSWVVTDGRFWAVVGRILLVSLIAIGVGLATSSVTSIAEGPNDGIWWELDSAESNPQFDTDLNADFGRVFGVSAGSLIADAVGSIVTTVLIGGLFAAVTARLYRTRNPRSGDHPVDR